MRLPTSRTHFDTINTQITYVYRIILPALLLFITVWFLLGFRVKLPNNNKESWVNYTNIPFGEIRTGKDCPIAFYERPEYRLPYRYPLGIATSYPVKHIAPLML